MTDIAGASILVVGATGGLGSEISRLLVNRGAHLTLVARDQARLEALGVPGTLVAADVTQPGVPAHLVSNAVGGNGKLDGVIILRALSPLVQSASLPTMFSRVCGRSTLVCG